MQTKTTRWFLAAGAAAALTAAAPALAAKNSGGPGGLGTEVPHDSRLARQYFNYYLPTDTPEALRIRDGVQRLHADHQAALTLARVGAASQSPEVRKLAQQVGDRVGALDGSLVDVAKDSLLALSGPAYEQATQAGAETVQTAQAAAGDRDAQVKAGLVKALERAQTTVDELRPQARKALREQLASVLERDHDALRDLIKAAQALPGPA